MACSGGGRHVSWVYDHEFDLAASVLWPDDYKLARWVGPKGHADASRRMERRREGFRAVRRLGQMQAKIATVVADARRSLP